MLKLCISFGFGILYCDSTVFMLCLNLGTKFTWKVKCSGLKYLFDHQKLGRKLFPGLLKDIQIACVHWFAALLRPPPPLDITVINMWCNCDVAIINISMVRSLWHVSMWTYQLFAEMLPTNIFPGDWAGLKPSEPKLYLFLVIFIP